MALHAFVSAGGSPGVTTAALAIALAWPGQVVMAECDPSGGDVMAGLLAAGGAPRDALMKLAAAAAHGTDAVAAAIAENSTSLDEGKTRLVDGVSDPRQVAALARAWPRLAAALAAGPGDVIADCGRLDTISGGVSDVLAAAATVTMILRPTLRQMARAKPRAEALGEMRISARRLVLVVGPGPRTVAELHKALDADVSLPFPFEANSARRLVESGEGSRRGDRRLMAAARRAGHMLRAQASLGSAGGHSCGAGT